MMQGNLLGVTVKEFEKKILLMRLLCVAVGIIALVINLVLCLLRNDNTHVVFLILNIIIDVFAFCFIYAYYSLAISPGVKLLKLCKRSAVNGTMEEGVITDISETTVMNRGLECYTISVECEKGNRVMYLPSSSAISLEKDKRVRISVVENIITQCEEII